MNFEEGVVMSSEARVAHNMRHSENIRNLFTL